jgi:Ni,Fe-hydrogenase III component G
MAEERAMAIVDQATITRVKEVVAGRSNSAFLSGTQRHADTLHFAIEKRAMRAVVEGLVNELQARFMISVGTDKRPVTGDFAILHLFSLDADHLYVLLESPISENDLRIESITEVIPGANWAEREFRDAIGVHPEGHPDPRRLLLADDWPEGVYPLRRDFPYNYQPPRAENVRPQMREPPKGASVVPLGPFFPVLEEPSYWRMFVEGETVVGCDTRLFYNHRGIEKLGDSVLTYNQIPYLAERICGISWWRKHSCSAVSRALTRQ